MIMTLKLALAVWETSVLPVVALHCMYLAAVTLFRGLLGRTSHAHLYTTNSFESLLEVQYLTQHGIIAKSFSIEFIVYITSTLRDRHSESTRERKEGEAKTLLSR